MAMEKSMVQTTLPEKLRLIDGELVCADSSDVREYPRDYAKRAEIDPDEPITLMRQIVAQRDRDDALMMRHWAA